VPGREHATETFPLASAAIPAIRWRNASWADARDSGPSVANNAKHPAEQAVQRILHIVKWFAPMSQQIPEDLAEKAAIMQEFRRLRAAGEPVPADLYARHVWATNDHYATGPEPGDRIPEFALPDQNGRLRSLRDLSGPNGLLLVFHRSADW